MRLLIDENTKFDMIFFYNPSWKRYVGMLRYPRGTPFFPFFITRVYWFKLCATVTFLSRPEEDRSKEIYIEATACVDITYDEFEHFTTDEEFDRLLEHKEAEAVDRAVTCLENMFGISDYEVAGITYYFQCHPRNSERALSEIAEYHPCREPEEKCRYERPTLGKQRDLTEEWLRGV